jgi:hypothetical protein
MQRTISLNCGRSTFVPMSIRLAGCLHECHCLNNCSEEGKQYNWFDW